MRNPVEIMAAIHDAGGQLKVEDERLRMALPADAPASLKDEIRASKAALLDLHQQPFAPVRSETTGLCYWAADDATKTALIGHGAEPGAIYLPHELRTLLGQSCTQQDLSAIHLAKSMFDGTIVSQ